MRIFILLFIFLTTCVHSSALYISEIMYDPIGADTGREWIEVFNDTASPIVLSEWKFFESGTNHGVTSYQGGDSVSANGYAVVADNPVRFLADYPSYQGPLYDSAFSLINTGELLSMKDGSGAVVDTLTYDTSLGGANDGTTLSKMSGTWVKGEATPGLSNKVATVVENGGGGNGTIATTTETQGTITQMAPPSADIVLYLPKEKLVVAGADTEFTAYSMTRAGKLIDNVKYTWAFGDGGQRTGTTTPYRYVYPGRYLVYLMGTNGAIAGDARMLVRVVAPDLTISSMGSGKYGTYIDVTNPNTYDLDVSGWNLVVEGMKYPFPPNTIVLAQGSTRFSGVAMGFASTTVASSTQVTITFPNFEEVTRYQKQDPVNTFMAMNTITATPTVLGVATTTLPKPVAVQKSLVVKKVIAATSTIQAPVKVAATTIIGIATSTKPLTQKDTRIVEFFRSLFGK